MEMRIVSLLLKDLGLRWGSTIGDIDPPSKHTFDVQLNFNWFCLFCVHFSLIVSNIEFHNVQYLPYPLNILNYKSCWLLFSFLFFPSLPNMVLSECWSGCSLQSSHAEVSFQVLIQRFGSKHAAGTLGKEYIAQRRTKAHILAFSQKFKGVLTLREVHDSKGNNLGVGSAQYWNYYVTTVCTLKAFWGTHTAHLSLMFSL